MSSAAEGPDGTAPDPAGPKFRVRIEVDGQPLPLKDFLHDMVGGAAMGLVSGLRGAERPTELRIEVDRL